MVRLHWRGTLAGALRGRGTARANPPPPGACPGLIGADWELASHSSTHPDLTSLDDAQLIREIAGSPAAIPERRRVPAEFFCDPSGRYDDRVVAIVRDAGYLGATTTDDGLASRDDSYCLARIRVSRSDGVDGFAARLVELEKG